MANQNLEKTKALAIFENTEQDSSDLVEITAFIRVDQAFALEMIETAKRQQFGTDFDKNKLIQEALDLLIEKHIFAFRIGNNKLAKGNI